MEERYGYCNTCRNKGMCKQCYRGSWYENDNTERDVFSAYGTF